VVDEAVIGHRGTVIVRIRGENAPGEITVSVRGGSETFIAYADDPYDVGAEVLVVSSRGSRSVDVAPWP
jgi:membrane protein implicated in regulation of membrane protease activity